MAWKIRNDFIQTCSYFLIFIVNINDSMITRTYLNKMNAIIKDSDLNTGINPVSELLFGRNTSRVLIYFDHSRIKKMMEDGTMPDKSKITHRLKITNAGSLDFTMLHHTDTSSVSGCIRKRASSFDLIFFLIPKDWDAGKGFDYSRNEFMEDAFDTKSPGWGNRLVSTDGCNWFQRRNGLKWDEPGIYSNDTLANEYDNFSSDSGSTIIFARERFDVGNENIDLDITDIFNKFVSGELENYGIGIAFTPALERIGEDENSILGSVENYIGFFTPRTNTFFEPFVETQYHDYIDDDRANFVLGKDNKLYLYCNLGGQLTNLDELPTVTVTDSNEEVITDAYGRVMENIEAQQYSKGIYYIDLKLSQFDIDSDTMFFDTWNNIKYNGSELAPVELDFTVKNVNMFFNIGDRIEANERFTPNVTGINDSEDIKRGDIRKLKITARVQYTTQDYELINGIETRLYVRDGTRELDVLPWEPVNKTFLENYTIIDTNILIPQRYYVDIKIKYGMEEIIHHDVLHFNIVDDINNRYA